MATNPPKGDGHRNGAVRSRSQTYNPRINRYEAYYGGGSNGDVKRKVSRIE